MFEIEKYIIKIEKNKKKMFIGFILILRLQFVCILALIAICSGRKLHHSKWPALRSDSAFAPAEEEWNEEEQWGGEDQWGADEQWGNEEGWEPSVPSEPILKPLKQWKEPIYVEKKVPVYVPGIQRYSRLLSIVFVFFLLQKKVLF